MAKILETKSIYYDDVNLIAQPTALKSRKQITDIRERIIVSPMASIVGETFALEALKNGIQVPLHRFCDIETQWKLFVKLITVYPEYRKRIWGCIGLNDSERFSTLYGVGCQNFIVDIANGYLGGLIDFVLQLPSGINLMIGNVHSKDILKIYDEKLGLERTCKLTVRVGVGQGSPCCTKDMTGYTRGQITELLECSEYCRNTPSRIWLAADGGIRDSGCATKAFSAGADYIVLGGYFSHAEEAVSVLTGDLKYWGGASNYQQELQNGVAKRHSEGKVLELDKNKIKPLKVLVEDLEGGIQSGISYSGFNSLTNFIGNGTFELKY